MMMMMRRRRRRRRMMTMMTTTTITMTMTMMVMVIFFPGVIFSSGHVWHEQRKVALEILREFGLGKNILAEKIQAEVLNTFLVVYSCFLIA
jgi:hypothetical protein